MKDGLLVPGFVQIPPGRLCPQSFIFLHVDPAVPWPIQQPSVPLPRLRAGARVTGHPIARDVIICSQIHRRFGRIIGVGGPTQRELFQQVPHR